jgi:hypothetical protein
MELKKYEVLRMTVRGLGVLVCITAECVVPKQLNICMKLNLLIVV